MIVNYALMTYQPTHISLQAYKVLQLIQDRALSPMLAYLPWALANTSNDFPDSYLCGTACLLKNCEVVISWLVTLVKIKQDNLD